MTLDSNNPSCPSQADINIRRFDVSSWVSIELLNEFILSFIFNDLVRDRLLGKFSGNMLHGGQFGGRRVCWNIKRGIATKGASDEFIFLGANAADIVDITKILQDEGLSAAVNGQNQEGPLAGISDNQRYAVNSQIIDEAIMRLGDNQLIKICTCASYSVADMDQFWDQHTIPEGSNSPSPRRRLFAPTAKGQGKIVCISYDAGDNITKLSLSHPKLEKEKTVRLASEPEDEPFVNAKITYKIWSESDG